MKLMLMAQASVLDYFDWSTLKLYSHGLVLLSFVHRVATPYFTTAPSELSGRGKVSADDGQLDGMFLESVLEFSTEMN
ncbi:Protein of unknown function [Gryllus bimaculatus]|nr:Protein of unknown function [Gryllus bimaculatus]